MRRKLNKKTIIFTILVGFFSLSSYFTDQMVVRKETQINILQSEEEDLYFKNSDKLNSLLEFIMYGEKYRSLVTNYNNKIDFLLKLIILEDKHDRKFRPSFLKENDSVSLANIFARRSSTYSTYTIQSINSEYDTFKNFYNLNIKKTNSEILNQIDDLQAITKLGNEKKFFYSSDIAKIKSINEKIEKNIIKISNIYNDEYFKRVEDVNDLNKKVLSKFTEIQKQVTYKNMLIIISIILQILSIMMLIFLFRSLIIFKKS